MIGILFIDAVSYIHRLIIIVVLYNIIMKIHSSLLYLNLTLIKLTISCTNKIKHQFIIINMCR